MDKDLVIVRVFDAPLERVWRAWTEPEAFMKWWGPKDFTCPIAKMDVREGGTYHWCMRGPDGKDYWTVGTYLEIVPMERIVYTDSFADKDGNEVPASAYGMTGEWADATTVTVMFEEEGGKTKMTLTHVGIPAGETSEMTGAGWNQSFDKMSESLNVSL